MGKNQHSKDRLFVTATEHRELYGGKKKAVERKARGGRSWRCYCGHWPCVVRNVASDAASLRVALRLLRDVHAPIFGTYNWE